MNLHPYFKRLDPARQGIAAPSSAEIPWSVPGICQSYGWPRGLPGGGTIAIIELGGGYSMVDMNKFFSRVHQTTPQLTDVSVDGTTNRLGGGADVEVALDIQIAGASYYVATGSPARIRVYWAQDITQALLRAAADGCDVCSISWGADEANWGVAAAQQLEMAAAAATQAGMVIFAAAGDNDSSDGGPTPANVDLPAAAPHIVGCGGTMRPRNSGPALPETVWNNNPGESTGEGTGGGYSTFFRQPPWQAGAVVETVFGHRLVPDVSANADPNTGYHVVVWGQDVVVGGTSAVAPLYAGLFAAFGRKLGFVNPKLWDLANRGVWNDITVGDNGAYKAQVGADPCTGLGTPRAAALAALFHR